MQLAFTLFNYFPYGGLERDMLAVARASATRGHKVTIYTRSWEGDKPADLDIVEVPAAGLSNHGKNSEFARNVAPEIKRRAADSVIVGFNKMPGLDVYYAADVCFVEKAHAKHGSLYRLTPRYRQYQALEKAVFAADSQTEILLIAASQIDIYQRHYQTPRERMHLLAPGIRRDCIVPVDYATQRQRLRQKYALADDTQVILFVGSDYKRKGLDRALRGIAALPPQLRANAQLWVVGKDNKDAFAKLARTLQLQQQVQFLGARDDIPQLMWSADLLLHPAYSEAAGLVLLEAMVAAIPVIASSVCGHAHYIDELDMGVSLAHAEQPDEIAAAISSVLAKDRQHWLARAQDIIAHADIFSMPERAAEIIEQVGVRKNSSSQTCSSQTGPSQTNAAQPGTIN